MDYRKYETIYTFLPDVTEEVTKRVNARFKELIDAGGKLLKEDDWGVRRTAYPVLKRSKAHFFHITYAGNPGLVNKLERQLRIADEVTKFHSFLLSSTVTEEELAAEVVYASSAFEERSKSYRRDNNFRSKDSYGGGEGRESRPYNNREGQDSRPYNNREGQESRPYNNREGQDSRPYNNREGQDSRPYNNNREGRTNRREDSDSSREV